MQKNVNLCDFQPILRLIMNSGAMACGVKEISRVSEKVTNSYNDWLKGGNQAGMHYLENHGAIREDPRMLLDGARSIISIAYSYHQAHKEVIGGMNVASYALGDDYHDVLRNRLQPVTEALKTYYGAESRICIDSAPIHERYWAVECGLGEICRNGNLFVHGVGTEVFLAEIITTAVFNTESFNLNHSPQAHWESALKQNVGSKYSEEKCIGCGACIRICPGNAIGERGIIDSRRCINYLTIEHKGDFDEGQKEIMHNAGGLTLFGCDRCQRVCPLNHGKAETQIGEFHVRESYQGLTPEKISEMKPEEFSRVFKGSPLKRAKLTGLKRNLDSSK